MREDMAKVIVERPRINRGYVRSPNRSAWRQIDWDEQPSGIGLKRQWKYRKSLNENLQPLFRFINSKVGQPWDRVMSEIRERINLNSAVQLHIWQHVEQFVCQIPRENKRGWEWCAFYVDESTGILTRNMQYYRFGGRRKSNAPSDLNGEDADRRQFFRIKGEWRKVIIARLPRENWEECWDAYYKCHAGRVGLKRLYDTYGRGGVYGGAVVPVTPEELLGLPR